MAQNGKRFLCKFLFWNFSRWINGACVSVSVWVTSEPPPVPPLDPTASFFPQQTQNTPIMQMICKLAANPTQFLPNSTVQQFRLKSWNRLVVCFKESNKSIINWNLIQLNSIGLNWIWRRNRGRMAEELTMSRHRSVPDWAPIGLNPFYHPAPSKPRPHPHSRPRPPFTVTMATALAAAPPIITPPPIEFKLNWNWICFFLRFILRLLASAASAASVGWYNGRPQLGVHFKITWNFK